MKKWIALRLPDSGAPGRQRDTRRAGKNSVWCRKCAAHRLCDRGDGSFGVPAGTDERDRFCDSGNKGAVTAVDRAGGVDEAAIRLYDDTGSENRFACEGDRRGKKSEKALSCCYRMHKRRSWLRRWKESIRQRGSDCYRSL